MKKYYYKKSLIGIKISVFPEGSVAHTGKDNVQESVGILTLKHKKGAILRPHLHKDLFRVTNHLQEAFIVRKGKVLIDLYGQDGVLFKQITLKEGELFLAINGGHGFQMVEDSEIYEIKNGPFREDKTPLAY